MKGTILVTDAGRGCAIAFLRSLGRAGWRMIAADADRRSLGFRSRYAADRLVYPDPAVEPKAFIDTMRHAVDRHGVDLVVPVTDEVIHLLARARSGFPCRLAIADDEPLATVTDKSATLRLAERLGVPMPATRFVTAAEAREAAAEIGWPVVLKASVSPSPDPVTGDLVRRPVSYANTPEQLEQILGRYVEGQTLLLQSYCPGEGHGVEMLALDGRPVAAFQHRRLAEVPVSGGASAWRESVPLDPQLLDYSTRLVETLGWTGLIMVEFKVGDDIRLMEINGRVWGSLPLAVASGMDFPSRLVELLLGEPKRPDNGPCADYRVGMRAYNLELTALWMASVLAGRKRYPYLPYPTRRDAVSAALGMLSGPRRFDILTRDDPRPGLAELSKIAR